MSHQHGERGLWQGRIKRTRQILQLKILLTGTSTDKSVPSSKITLQLSTFFLCFTGTPAVWASDLFLAPLPVRRLLKNLKNADIFSRHQCLSKNITRLKSTSMAQVIGKIRIKCTSLHCFSLADWPGCLTSVWHTLFRQCSLQSAHLANIALLGASALPVKRSLAFGVLRFVRLNWPRDISSSYC